MPTSKTGYSRAAMSHSITVTRTTTTTTTSAIILNTGYLKTFSGLLKLFEVILAGVCLGIAAYYRGTRYYVGPIQEQFFICTATTVFVASFCLLVACLLSLSTGSIIAKTIYELVYHFVAFVLVFCASITLLIDINQHNYSNHPYLSASIIGLILSALYLMSTILAYRSYRGA